MWWVKRVIWACLFFSLNAYGVQEQEKAWTFSIETRLAGLSNYEERTGSFLKYRVDSKYFSHNYNYTQDLEQLYGVQSEAIFLRMSPKLTLVPTVFWKKRFGVFSGLGLSASWSRFDSPLEGVVPRESEITGIGMWDNSFSRFYNELDSLHAFSPMNYAFRNTFESGSCDIFATAPVGEHSQLELGLRVAYTNEDQSRFLASQFFAKKYLSFFDWIKNDVSLRSYGRAHSVGAGPSVGYRYEEEWGTFSFSQKALWLSTTRSGIFNDIDDIHYKAYQDSAEAFSYLHGVFTLDSFTASKILFVSELNAKVHISSLSVFGREMRLGCAGFLSVWWDLPTAPEFSVPGVWQANATKWNLRSQTLVFSGISGVIEIRF